MICCRSSQVCGGNASLVQCKSDLSSSVRGKGGVSIVCWVRERTRHIS
jgi:hypothetical protein